MSSTSSFEKQASRTESPPFTTSSNSSGVKPSSQTESPPFLLCPDLSSNQRMSPRTLDHPNATKNIKNLPPSPIPTSRTRIANYDKDNDMYRLNSVHRSASTRDFRRTSLRNQFDVHAYGDYWLGHIRFLHRAEIILVLKLSILTVSLTFPDYIFLLYGPKRINMSCQLVLYML